VQARHLLGDVARWTTIEHLVYPLLLAEGFFP